MRSNASGRCCLFVMQVMNVRSDLPNFLGSECHAAVVAVSEYTSVSGAASGMVVGM